MMKKKTKIAAAVIASLVIGLMPVMGLSTVEAAPADMTNAGGWTITEQEAVALPEEVATGFSEAAYGTDLKPVALVAQQIVKGTNDMLLCLSEGEYRMIIIYRDLEENAELTKDSPFNLSDYTKGGGTAPAESVDGGWFVPKESTSLLIPNDAMDAFNKALEGFAGSEVVPMALLGTQVVAGLRYAFLCRVTPTTLNPVSSMQVVTIFSDLEGNSSIEGFSIIDPKDFSRNGELVYRLYNPNSGEHFYTASVGERDALVVAGWNYESDGNFTAPTGKVDALPVYRLYNSNAGEHLFTLDEEEVMLVKAAGWTDEGIAFYAYKNDSGEGIPVYRTYNPNDGHHFFTTNLIESRSCIKAAWDDEGIAWNVEE